MFCDGKCVDKKGRRCGMLMEIVLENMRTNTPEIQQKCCFHAMVESLHRLEYGDRRIQAAVESSRNENVKYSSAVQETISKGFMGLINTINSYTPPNKQIDGEDIVLIEEE